MSPGHSSDALRILIHLILTLTQGTNIIYILIFIDKDVRVHSVVPVYRIKDTASQGNSWATAACLMTNNAFLSWVPLCGLANHPDPVKGSAFLAYMGTCKLEGDHSDHPPLPFNFPSHRFFKWSNLGQVKWSATLKPGSLSFVLNHLLYFCDY